MSEEILIIISISLIIFISPLVARTLRLPSITVEIMLGALAGYFAFIMDHAILDLASKLGFLYLMFLAGLEIDLKKIINISPTILKKSLIYHVILFSLSAIAFVFLSRSVIAFL